jgi:ribokinase
MFDFVAVGDVMLDVRLSSPIPGTRQHAAVVVSAGGSAANAALAAARLGVTSAVVGAIGDDMVGSALETELSERGVVPLLRRIDGAATGSTVYAGDAVVADRGANARIAVPDLPLSRVTLVSAYLPAEALAAALAAASGIRACDLQGVLDDEPGATVVLGPGLDLDALAGRHDVVCSTLGAEGAEAAANGGRARVAPSRVIEETLVGAGDAFAAGFLLGLADGLPLAECLTRGCNAVTQ